MKRTVPSRVLLVLVLFLNSALVTPRAHALAVKPAHSTLTLTISPTQFSMPVGLSRGYIATLDSNGKQSDLTQHVVWTSSNPAVATISNSGMVAAQSAGTTVIKATWYFGSASTQLSVVDMKPANLYLSDASSCRISQLAIDPTTGKLGGIQQQSLGSKCSQTQFDVRSSQDWLVASNPANKSVSALSIDGQSGKLTARGSITTSGLTPAMVALHPTLQVAYVVDPADSSIGVLQMKSDGSLSAGAQLRLTKTPSAVVVHPNGNFVYIASTDVNSISIFHVNKDGSLTYLSDQFNSGVGPYGLVIDPTGGFLYTADMYSGTVSGYSIDASGQLASLPGSPFAAMGAVSSLAVDPTGSFLYAGSEPDQLRNFSYILGYAIDAKTGMLNLADVEVTGLDPVAVKVDPSGKFLYAVDSTMVGSSQVGEIWAYRIDPATGRFTKIQSVGFSGDPKSMAVTGKRSGKTSATAP